MPHKTQNTLWRSVCAHEQPTLMFTCCSMCLLIDMNPSLQLRLACLIKIHNGYATPLNTSPSHQRGSTSERTDVGWHTTLVRLMGRTSMPPSPLFLQSPSFRSYEMLATLPNLAAINIKDGPAPRQDDYAALAACTQLTKLTVSNMASKATNFLASSAHAEYVVQQVRLAHGCAHVATGQRHSRNHEPIPMVPHVLGQCRCAADTVCVLHCLSARRPSSQTWHSCPRCAIWKCRWRGTPAMIFHRWPRYHSSQPSQSATWDPLEMPPSCLSSRTSRASRCESIGVPGSS